MFKILEISPDAVESEGHIATAYLKVSNEEGEKFWCYCLYWRAYFPYCPKPSKWGIGEKLIKNLVGKEITSTFSFVNLEPVEKTNTKDKYIFQNPTTQTSDATAISGKIIETERYDQKDYKKKIGPDPKKYEKLIVDCKAATVKVGVEKGKFLVGDFISCKKGMLNAYIIKVGDAVL